VQDQEQRTLEDVLAGERTVMLVTADQRARPMTVTARDDARLWFLTSRSADWVGDLEDGEIVAVVVSDLDESLFVSLTGASGTTDDAAVRDRLWNPVMQAWFDGADDPDLIALHVDVTDGEYWDGPDTGAGRALRGLAAVATGRGRELMGEQGDVAS
jgi:general stress protein 26